MVCHECGGALVKRLATEKEPYRYAASGITELFLLGIDVWECPKCRTEEPVIPRIAELHQLIFHTLVWQPAPLRGDQLRFLRKHAGLPAKKFASLLGIDPAHLSRVETGATEKLGAQADRLARGIVAAAKGCEKTRSILLDFAAQLEKGRAPRPAFRLEKNGWEAAA